MNLLWQVMRGNRLLYAGAVVAVCLATGVGLLSPLVLRATIDSIIGDAPLVVNIPWINNLIQAVGGKTGLARNLWMCSSVLVVLSVTEALLLFLKGKWSATAAEATARRLRDRIYDHLQHLPYEYHVNAETGDIVQRCTSDVETIRQFLAVQFVEVGYTLFMAAAIVPLMLSLHRTMTLVGLAILPVIFSFAMFFFIKVKQAFEVSDEVEGKMSTILQENLTGVRVVRAFARQRFEIEKFDRMSAEFRDRRYKVVWYMAAYWMVSSFLGMAQYGAVLLIGAYWASQGKLSIGTLVVFLMYLQRVIHPIRQLGKILTEMGQAMVSIGRVQAILDQSLDTSLELSERPAIQGNLEFNNVSFEYEPGKPVLKDISFRVKQGQTVAILGPTGSGKTSLVHLLARMYDYQRGSIKVDGVELKAVEKKWLRKHVGLVLQEPFLFSKTIKQNISLPRKDAPEEQVVEAAKTAAVHDVILNFENGYETSVGEKGVTLSGGQKQRVAIAQSLLKHSPILVLDDSLSAVDTETDAAIRYALRRRNHATTFMISHRVTTLSEADLILVLENGRLVQSGSHTELIEQDGLYRRIWQIQNELEDDLQAEMN